LLKNVGLTFIFLSISFSRVLLTREESSNFRVNIIWNVFYIAIKKKSLLLIIYYVYIIDCSKIY